MAKKTPRGRNKTGLGLREDRNTLQVIERCAHDNRASQSRKTESPSPNGGSTARTVRRLAFFVARGCVDHQELILNRAVVALVGNDIDDRPSGTLLSPVHQLFQFLLASLQGNSVGGDLLAGIKFICTRIGEKPSHERT
jgi:hypothetical protein